jgi:16S rRNA (guanine966-N2)-methyltransferase
MRVISGSARGLKLLAPPGTSVRPTGDRVREAVFNSLGSMGAVAGASVVDLFAGSGALGIEALSRGATECTFCESDPRAVAVLRENLAHTRTAESAEVVVGDTMVLLSPGGPLDGIAAGLALADPPYDFDRWVELLGLVEPSGVQLVVAESDRPVEPTPCWRQTRQRAYGSTVVTILERSPDLDPGGSDPRDPHAREENHQ